MSPEWVYRAELLRQLNIKASRLDTYLKRGLIPYKTEMVKERNRRYRFIVKDVRKRLRQIDKMQDQGYSLDEIKTKFDKLKEQD